VITPAEGGSKQVPFTIDAVTKDGAPLVYTTA
jgi:hypothetical protein